MTDSWLTRPLFTCPPRVARALRVTALVLLFLGVFSPGLVTLWWHLRHGNTIRTRGTTVFVPLAWTADLDDSLDASLTRLPVALSWRESMSFISVSQEPTSRNGNMSVLLKTDEVLFRELHGALGETVSGPVKIGTETQPVWCMEGEIPGRNRLSASCLAPGGKWRAELMGTRNDRADFFAIVRKLN